jgi:hypothetical protein
MRRDLKCHPPTALGLVLMLACGLALTGCSDDDENPTGPPNATEFNEEIAGAQAAVTAPMAIAMVENMPLFAAGVAGKDFSYSFSWDAETQSWRAETTYDAEGYSFEFVYHLQYRDAQGDPLPSEVDAVSMWYTEDGVGEFVFQDERSSLYARQEFANEIDVSGLDTATLLIAGAGGYDFAYEAHSDGNSAILDLTVTWETLGDGVSFPAGGCPTGTIRYHLAPYYVDVVFDGDSTVDYALYTDAGVPVPGHAGTEIMVCGR